MGAVLENLAAEVTAIKAAIIGSYEKPGLLAEVRESNRLAQEQTDTLKDHTKRIEALEATPGRKALDLWERIGLIAAGVLLTSASHLALAGIKVAQVQQPAQQQHGGVNR